MKTKMDYSKKITLKSETSQTSECCQNLKTGAPLMKKSLLLLCVSVVLIMCSMSLSVKAQTAAERLQFYNYFKNAMNSKTAILNADPDQYQKAKSSGWFDKMALGLKNAENFRDGKSYAMGRNPNQVTGGNCAVADPFCTQNGITYPAGVSSGFAEAGPDYGCLSTVQNPAWYYMKVGTGGDIHIAETNNNTVDVDFILWGPFNTLTNVCAGLTAANTVDCSYSTSANEDIDILNSTAGDYFILLITNYGNAATDITLTKTSGTGETDCSVTCMPWIEGGNSAIDCQQSNINANNNIIGINETNANPLRLFTNGTEKARILSTGEIGIGTTTPHSKLEVNNGAIAITGGSPQGGPMILFGDNLAGGQSSTNYGNWGIEYEPTQGGLNFWKPFQSVGGFDNYLLFLKDNGKVGINTNNPDEQLTVCGNIHATGYLHLGGPITINNIYKPCPDYVFDKKYKLMSLKEVEEYIDDNHHLPNVPSASEIQNNGLDVAGMSFNQLEKLEELYLHVIELNKSVEKLQAANVVLQAQMKQLDNK